MKIMQSIIENSMPVWEQCVQEKFLSEMMEGTLSKQKFLDYIVQDSIYLRDYLRAYAMAIVKSHSFKEMQVFYSALGFVNDSENVTRLKYLKDNGMTDEDVEQVAKLPECAAYTKFLIDTSQKEDTPEILMSVLPCMVGYHLVFEKVKQRAPKILDSYYGPLVEDYTSAAYSACCDEWTAFADTLCENLDAERQEGLRKIFVRACEHELYFWQMAGRE
ncbi:MAG: thiaminase II [Oscillospiraceae bacterium]